MSLATSTEKAFALFQSKQYLIQEIDLGSCLISVRYQHTTQSYFLFQALLVDFHVLISQMASKLPLTTHTSPLKLFLPRLLLGLIIHVFLTMILTNINCLTE